MVGDWRDFIRIALSANDFWAYSLGIAGFGTISIGAFRKEKNSWLTVCRQVKKGGSADEMVSWYVG